MIVENSPVDNGLREGGGSDQQLPCPIAHTRRVNSTYIPYIACDTQHSIYTSSHAQEKSRSLESTKLMTPKLANKVFSVKSTQIMHLERHKEPYNIEFWTHKQGM